MVNLEAQYVAIVRDPGRHVVQRQLRQGPSELPEGIRFRRRFLKRLPKPNPVAVGVLDFKHLHLDPVDLLQFAWRSASAAQGLMRRRDINLSGKTRWPHRAAGDRPCCRTRRHAD